MSLEVRDVTVDYGSVHALQNVSLSLADGQIHGLIGMNGSGKSTLFNTIAGLIRPTTGTVNSATRHSPAASPTSSALKATTFPISVRRGTTGRYGHGATEAPPRHRPGRRRRCTGAHHRAATDRSASSGGQKKRNLRARGLGAGRTPSCWMSSFAGGHRQSSHHFRMLRSLADDGAAS